MMIFIPSLGNIWVACIQIVVLIAQITAICILAEKRGRLLQAREQWRSERQAECFDALGLKRCDTDSLN